MIIHCKLIFQLFSTRWKRTLSFIIALALLSTTVGLLAYHFTTEKDAISPVSIGFVDNDKSPLFGLVLQMALPLAENSSFLEVTEKNSLENGKKAVEDGELSALVVFPDSFLDSVLSGENRPISIILSRQTPTHGELIQFFAQDILGILQESQIGIYSAMEYAKEEYPSEYERVARDVNRRFIATTLSYSTLIQTVTPPVTGEVPPSLHYFFTTAIFLIFLSGILYIPIVQKAYTPLHRISLIRLGVNSFKTIGGISIGWGVWNLLFSLISGIGLVFFSSNLGLIISPFIVFPLVFTGILIASIGTCLTFLFRDTVTGTLALCAYSGLNLFFSGGIIPLFYLKPWVGKAATLFPSYWLTHLLSENAVGSLSPLPVVYLLGFSLIFFLVGAYGYQRPLREVK